MHWWVGALVFSSTVIVLAYADTIQTTQIFPNSHEKHHTSLDRCLLPSGSFLLLQQICRCTTCAYLQGTYPLILSHFFNNLKTTTTMTRTLTLLALAATALLFSSCNLCCNSDSEAPPLRSLPAFKNFPSAPASLPSAPAPEVSNEK